MTRQLEAKFRNKYLMMNYPDKLQWKNARLGPLPDVPLAKMYSVTQRRADAIVKEDRTIIIIETKLRKFGEAVGQLQLYRDLFKETPEFSEFKDYQIKLQLVVPREDIHIKSLCNDRGIDFIVFPDAETLRELSK